LISKFTPSMNYVNGTFTVKGNIVCTGNISGSSISPGGGGGSTVPGTPVTSVQYNDGGAFAGDADFTWNKTTNALTVTGDITSSANVSGAFFYGDGSGLTNVVASSAPAGSNTEIQFNADGAAGADADLAWFTGSNTLVVTGDVSASVNISGSAFYGDGSNLTGLARDYGALAADPPGESPSYTEDFESTTPGSLPVDWTSFGDSTWIVSASNPHGGTRCAISQVITDNESTSLVYTASLATPATVTFWWDVSSESGFDFLKFYIDGVEKESISGTPGYAQVSTSLPAGTSALKWTYSKDVSTSTGLDQGYVDDFEITPITWSAGDLYYNTVLNMTMHYDASRLKWLSQETAEIPFGRNGFTGVGAYYRGAGNISYSSTHGRYAEYNGTIISLVYAKSDLAATSFEVTSNGTTVSTLVSFVETKSSSVLLNDNFSENTVLGVRNISSGDTTEDVMGTVRIKWRI